MQTPSEASPADLALGRGVVYAALALGFRPPSEETIDRLVDRDAIEALGRADG